MKGGETTAMYVNEEYNVTLDSFEWRVLVRGLSDIRNIRIAENKPIEDLNDVILKIIDTPPVKNKWRDRHEER